MMTRSAEINSPGDQTMAVWKAHADSLSLIKFIHDNPGVVDEVTQKICEAYKLTDAEIQERNDAVAAVEKANADVETAQEQLERILSDGQKLQENAKASVQKIYDAADQAKKDADKYLAEKKLEIAEEHSRLSDREDTVKDRETNAGKAEEEEAAWRAAKASWEQEKADWEEDYTQRLAKVEARERKRIAG